MTEQFTDPQNSRIADKSANEFGLRGSIPSYSVMDASFSYNLNKFTLETGINNLLNQSYFTRRATGYPGPGIIPSDPRSFYLTVELKL